VAETHPLKGKGLGKSRSLSKPSWSQIALPPPPSPLREDPVVCMCKSQDDFYMALGHASGSVYVYSLQPVLTCIQTIPTSARSRQLDQMNATHGSTSKRLLHFMHSIHQMAMAGDKLVLCTAQEVECYMLGDSTCSMNIGKGSALIPTARQPTLRWRHDLTEQPKHAVRLDVNRIGECLATWGAVTRTTQATASAGTTGSEVQGLVSLLQANTDIPQERLALSTKENPIQLPNAAKCVVAKFDLSCSDENRLVVLVECSDGGSAANGTRHPQNELWLMSRQLEDGFSSYQYSISCRAVIPSKSGKANLQLSGLSQARDGHFTLLACTRGGVRVYCTSSLELLHVYGDNLVLHGKTVQWQQAFMLFPHHVEDSENPFQVWRDDAVVERPDELQYRQALSDKAAEDASVMPPGTLVVGVPQAGKEPKELQDTLHLWHWLENGKVAAFTVSGPSKSGGVIPGLANSDGSLICVSYERGEMWQLKPTTKSDFPGVMYPAGYHVVDDNVEYLEDEDEVDVLIDGHLEGQDDQPEDDSLFMAEIRAANELDEAMRRSLMEAQGEVESDAEDEVIVVPSNNEEFAEKFATVLLCHPDVQLDRGEIDERNERESCSECGSSSPNKKKPSRSFVRGILKSFPQLVSAVQARAHFESRPSLDELTEMPLAPKPARGRQTKRLGLEATIKASIKPDLRMLMLSKEEWSKGDGCSLRDSQRETDILAEAYRRQENRRALADKAKRAQGKSAAVPQLATDDLGERNADASCKGDDTRGTTVAGSPEMSEEEVSQKIASAHVSGAAAEALAGMFALHRANSEDLASPRKRPSLGASDGIATATPEEHKASRLDMKEVTKKSELSEKKMSVDPPSDLIVDVKEIETVAKKSDSAVEHEGPVVQETSEEHASAALALGKDKPFIMTETSARQKEDGITEKAITLVVQEADFAVTGTVAPGGSSGTSKDSAMLLADDEKGAHDAAKAALLEAESSLLEETRGSVQSPKVLSSGLTGILSVGSEDQAESEYTHCDACRGRMVVHTCGKREIPIDYEAIERAEEEKRRKKEEEKKKIQAEKRRQADVRRREAKREKREEEERKRREELEIERIRLEEMERARQVAEEQRFKEELEKEKRRAELWQRLMQTQQQQEDSISGASCRQEARAGQLDVVNADASLTYKGNPIGDEIQPEQVFVHRPDESFAMQHESGQPSPSSGVQLDSPSIPMVPLSLERCTSAQLGTVEALAALANGFVQSPTTGQAQAISASTETSADSLAALIRPGASSIAESSSQEPVAALATIDLPLQNTSKINAPTRLGDLTENGHHEGEL
jgi:hypothetical protein